MSLLWLVFFFYSAAKTCAEAFLSLTTKLFGTSWWTVFSLSSCSGPPLSKQQNSHWSGALNLTLTHHILTPHHEVNISASLLGLMYIQFLYATHNLESCTSHCTLQQSAGGHQLWKYRSTSCRYNRELKADPWPPSQSLSHWVITGHAHREL